MKETIQQAGEEVAIVIYDAPLPPKYFRFSKKFIRTLFVVFPVSISLIFVALFSWGLVNRVQEVPRLEMPSVSLGNDSKFKELEDQVKALEQSNQELTDKLASQPAPGGTEDPYLMTIRKPYGMQNLMAQNKVSLDQFEFLQDSGKTNLKFQIIHANPETRVTGHVLVFMQSESGIMVYPKDANKALGSGLKYSMGEPFAVSRLRPTNAEFLQPVSGNVKFIIYIFSREGDLLLIKETDNFKAGPKS